jgi:choline dehydrogenase-like flavoprotein
MADPPVVVIGSGPTGAMATAALAARGVEVLLLDEGVHAPRGIVVRVAGNTLLRRMAWADYRADRLDPTSAPDVEWYSSLALGGLSNFWTAAVPRFAPDDFTEGARLHERYRWPVDYDALVPFYEIAERHLALTAGDAIPGVPANVARYHHDLPEDWAAIATAAAQAGHGVGAMPLAKGRPWMVARRGTEFNSYHCVLAPLLARGAFRLVRGARATALNWSSSQGRVESVDYVDVVSGERRTVPARAVVVAAGAIDSTVLLMRSRSSDFPRGLGNTQDLLGRYLHDHPREWWVLQTRSPLRALAHPVYVARRSHAASEPLLAASLTIGLASKAQRANTYLRRSATTFGVQVFGTMVPTPDRSLTIADGDLGTDPIRPRITLAYDRSTIANLEIGRERILEVLATAGVAATVPGPFHELHPGSSVHWGGSVRMHEDPQHGVLDGWNRVHDAPNVAVVDSSSFTTGPEKNPTLTAMALAARAADKLATDLHAGTL